MQVLLDLIGVLAGLALEGGDGCIDGGLDLGFVEGDLSGAGRGELSRPDSGPAAEDEEVRQGVAAETVGSVHAASRFTGRVQSGHGGCGGVGFDPDTAHDVVAGGADFHGLGGDVHAGQLLELVVHRRQAPTDVLGRAPRGDIEEDAAVGAAPAGLHFGVDRSGDFVAGEQLGGSATSGVVVVPLVGFVLGVGRLGPEHVGHIVEHEPGAFRVAQHAAVASDALGHQDAPDRQRPDHAGRVELDALHVDEVGTGP